VRGSGLGRVFALPAGEVTALEDVDLVVATGTLTAVAGPSGSGKSTLLRLVACLDRPTAGSLEVVGQDVVALNRDARRELRRRHLGIVGPVPAENLLEHLDVAGNIRAAARLRGPKARATTTLAEVGLDGRERARPVELSGGEQLLLGLVLALVGAPALVIADEPTASLDRASAERVVAAMRRAADEGATLLVAGHDPAVIDAADAVLRLDHGRPAP
jgi:ABC-type lipoprotein export system ATPase subunit